MKIEKLIDIGELEVQVHIDHEDIANAITSDSNSGSGIIYSINNFCVYMKAAPQDQIDKMNREQKNIIKKFLMAQADRF